MMLDESVCEWLSSPPLLTDILMSCDFVMTYQTQIFQNTVAILCKDSVYAQVKEQSPIGEAKWVRIYIDFDTIFDILRFDHPETKAKKLGEPYGIKFERFDDFLEFNNTNIPAELRKWQEVLARKMNERGFHQLYKPIKKVGKGNFASVYLVIRNDDGRKLATKAFSKEAAYAEDNGREALINQIKLMRMFSHKNLMKLYGVSQSQNSVYVNVELLEGGQLYDKIKAKYRFTLHEIKVIMKGILQGLEYMHQRGVMHRDLKPENILLRSANDFDCVIADFGLAQQVEKPTLLFVRCGTPGYVAPEVANLKDPKMKYGVSCDIFSLGVIFHILALRKSPFPGNQYDEVLAQNRACKINFETPEYQRLPQSWLNLLKGLLQRDPKKRITATEALNHEFFTKDSTFSSFINARRSSNSPMKDKSEPPGQESPLLLSRNMGRRNHENLRDDSCLKFRLNKNGLNEHSADSAKSVESIESPAVLKKHIGKGQASRFKRQT